MSFLIEQQDNQENKLAEELENALLDDEENPPEVKNSALDLGGVSCAFTWTRHDHLVFLRDISSAASAPFPPPVSFQSFTL